MPVDAIGIYPPHPLEQPQQQREIPERPIRIERLEQREAISEEIAQLKEEITYIAEATEFNAQKISFKPILVDCLQNWLGYNE